jgi:DNA-binding NarL/FixJ family response regulator
MILIVDDHPVFRDGVATSPARVADFAVVGVAASGEQAVDVATTHQPDIVLMDLNLPGISGVEATRRVRALTPPPVVLAVTMGDDDTVIAALRAGAAGYILKGSTGEEITAATRTAATGGAVFGPGIATRILAATPDADPRPATAR